MSELLEKLHTPEQMSATDILSEAALAACRQSDKETINGVVGDDWREARHHVWHRVAEQYNVPPATLRGIHPDLLDMEAALRLEFFLQHYVDGAERPETVQAAGLMQEGLVERISKDEASWQLFQAVLDHKISPEELLAGVTE